MQAVLDFINTHIYDIFIPLTALGVLRLAVCLLQLKHTAALREKKGVYHAVRKSYTEIGVWLGAIVGFVCALILPKVWFVWLVLAAALGVLGGKQGEKRGAEADAMYREIALELKREAEADAAREAASHTMESGAEALPEMTENTEITDTTEDKGETENG